MNTALSVQNATNTTYPIVGLDNTNVVDTLTASCVPSVRTRIILEGKMEDV
ncbi:hypothetical protein DPMN_068318 [Dreissena polymorpha]|uniref:Uncharacterized protein n=1 Tax=Dreissena polymorpha TaxID=45954 RepID=A0A9D4BU49_DREPO|nr:hypothetical protein DPMN_068318 [Dreissena polymorpha]